MTLTALSDEFDDADTGAVLGLTAYSYLSGFACLAGAIGVLKVGFRIVRCVVLSIYLSFLFRITPSIFASSMLITGLTWYCILFFQLQQQSCSSAYILKFAKKS